MVRSALTAGHRAHVGPVEPDTQTCVYLISFWTLSLTIYVSLGKLKEFCKPLTSQL